MRLALNFKVTNQTWEVFKHFCALSNKTIKESVEDVILGNVVIKDINNKESRTKMVNVYVNKSIAVLVKNIAAKIGSKPNELMSDLIENYIFDESAMNANENEMILTAMNKVLSGLPDAFSSDKFKAKLKAYLRHRNNLGRSIIERGSIQWLINTFKNNSVEDCLKAIDISMKSDSSNLDMMQFRESRQANDKKERTTLDKIIELEQLSNHPDREIKELKEKIHKLELIVAVHIKEGLAIYRKLCEEI